MWERLKKGSATIEALVCMIIVFYFLILSLKIYYQIHGSMVIEQSLIEISQMTVFCESLSEAESIAQTEAENRLNHYMDLDASSICTEVEYSPGSERAWKKGSFLSITIQANLVSPFANRKIPCQKTKTVMIERNET